MPIITSLLDIDFYKFLMGQWVFHRYADVPVRYAFTNRTTQVNIANFIDEEDLRRELDSVMRLRFTTNELQYLGSIDDYGEGLFSEDYLEFLGGLELPSYSLEKKDANYVLEFSGKWAETIYWETIALALVNELYYREKMRQLSQADQGNILRTGKSLLDKKIRIILENLDIRFSDFGTRRRYSKEWQDYIVGELVERVPGQFLGTSNVALARKYDITPIGTCAHETFMAMGAILESRGRNIQEAQNEVLESWWEEYGTKLSVALTDTWGSDFFFAHMTDNQARDWKGLRQDSGDPFEFGDKAIGFYREKRIDTKEKLIVFSDALGIETIVKLQNRFSLDINTGFGWGTNLTNDLGFMALSLVIKLIEANGIGTVKLSDNLAKAIGDPEDIERYKREFGYTGNTFTECRY